MKYLNKLIIAVLVILSMANTNINDSEALYERSLVDHLSSLNLDTVYIIKCADIELPARIKRYNIVEVKGPKEVLKGKEKEYAIKLLPVQLNKGNVEIIIIDYLLHEENGEVMMSNTGSWMYTFRYQSKAKQYQLLKRTKNKI